MEVVVREQVESRRAVRSGRGGEGFEVVDGVGAGEVKAADLAIAVADRQGDPAAANGIPGAERRARATRPNSWGLGTTKTGVQAADRRQAQVWPLSSPPAT